MFFVNDQRKLSYVFPLFLLAFSLPALSAPTYTWQGPYVGAYLGSASGNNRLTTNVGNISDTSYFTSTDEISAINGAGTSTKKPTSLIVGIQAGHNWDWKQIVYGVVFDYGTLPLNSSKKVVNNVYPDNSDTYSVYTSMSSNWLFTLRGRVGYQAVIQKWPSLFYITGGMAITQLKVSNGFSDNSFFAGTGGNHDSENEIGWTAGAGIEVVSFNNASVDLEYLYVHVPSVKTTSSIYNTQGGFGIPIQSLTNPFSTTGEFHAGLLKIGMNYRFDE